MLSKRSKIVLLILLIDKDNNKHQNLNATKVSFVVDLKIEFTYLLHKDIKL